MAMLWTNLILWQLSVLVIYRTIYRFCEILHLFLSEDLLSGPWAAGSPPTDLWPPTRQAV